MSLSPFLAQIFDGYQQISVTQYTQVSSLTFLVWEYLVTLPDEIRFVWAGRWTYPRVLFFMNRYQVLVWQIFHTIAILVNRRSEAVTVAVSEVWLRHLIGFSRLSVIVTVNMIMALRIYGLYGQTNWIVVVLAVMLLSTTAVQISLVIAYAPRAISALLPFSTNTTIWLPINPGRLYYSLLAGLVFDVPALILVVVRGVRHTRSMHGASFRAARIVRIMTRDSVAYFAAMTLLYIAISVTEAQLPGVEAFVAFGYGISMISVAGSRILLNLKQEAVHRVPMDWTSSGGGWSTTYVN
ncbi:hypothetical protein ONZ45_g8180 [Pleurotus djamor]|nr:hypothetical protein ONZ45_g8180 [Pleurotus djamor]